MSNTNIEIMSNQRNNNHVMSNQNNNTHVMSNQLNNVVANSDNVLNQGGGVPIPPPAIFNSARVSYAHALSALTDRNAPQESLLNPGRPNTLELFVPNYLRRSIRNLTRADYVNAVFRSLGTDAKRHIKCIQMGPTGFSCRVTFKEGASRTKESLLAKGIHMRNNFLFFQEAQRSSFALNVSNLPCELSDEVVANIFSKFGDVKRNIRIKDIDGLETGDRRLIIELRYHVPARLPVGKFTASVWYTGRPTCCSSCNWWGHKIQECPLKGRCAYCGELGHFSYACRTSSLLVPYNLPANEEPDLCLVHPLVFSLGLDDDDVSSEHTNDNYYYDNFEPADLEEDGGPERPDDPSDTAGDPDSPPETSNGTSVSPADSMDVTQPGSNSSAAGPQNPSTASSDSPMDSSETNRSSAAAGSSPPSCETPVRVVDAAPPAHIADVSPTPISTPPGSPVTDRVSASPMDTSGDGSPPSQSWADSPPPPDGAIKAFDDSASESLTQSLLLFPDTPMSNASDLPISSPTSQTDPEAPLARPSTDNPSVSIVPETKPSPTVETSADAPPAASLVSPGASVSQTLLTMQLFSDPPSSANHSGPSSQTAASLLQSGAPNGGIIPSSNPEADASSPQSSSADSSSPKFSPFSTPSFCEQLDPGRKSRKARSSSNVNPFAPPRTHSRSPVTTGRKRV